MRGRLGLRGQKRQLWSLAGAWMVTSLVAILTSMTGGFDLSPDVAWLVCLVTESGSAYWVAIPLVGFLVLLLFDPDVAWSVRKRQFVQLFLLLALALPLFALVNERLVKQVAQIPRPSHQALAAAGYIPDLEAFYAMTPAARHILLAPLQDAERAAEAARRLQIQPRVLAQWVHEVSSTFPSGHAWNAFLAASLFVLVTAARGTRVARAVCVVLLAWATAVAYSRILLGVHRPMDVIVGAALGIVLGLVAGWRVLLPGAPGHQEL